MLRGFMFHKYTTKGGRAPNCQLCERGDMIRLEDRFYSSEYKPVWPPPWKRFWRWLRWIQFRASFRDLLGN